MKKEPYIILMIFVLITCNITLLFGWGYWAHQRISRSAVFALPDSMRTFFYNHIDYLTEEAVMPDVRIYAINYREESKRHYIDLELLPEKTFDNVPATLAEAKAEYGDSLLQESGLLPWYIDDVVTKLTKAFKDKNKHYILFHAGDLAHYIGDAHVPLHTTVNHDGQLTGQKGIHSFWESEMTEKFGENFNLFTGNAVYIDDTKKATWQIIQNSHRLVDTLLLKEKLLRQQFPGDEPYIKDSTGKVVKSLYNQSKHTDTYSRKYHELLNGMEAQQLRLSIAAVANFWYTAWVNGGRPDLTAMDPVTLTERNRKFLKQDLKLWKTGKLHGLKSSREF